MFSTMYIHPTHFVNSSFSHNPTIPLTAIMSDLECFSPWMIFLETCGSFFFADALQTFFVGNRAQCMSTIWPFFFHHVFCGTPLHRILQRRRLIIAVLRRCLSEKIAFMSDPNWKRHKGYGNKQKPV